VQYAGVCWIATAELRQLAYGSDGGDDRLRRAAPPFAPFGGLAGGDGAVP
jgi:hypothetical protein